MRSEQIRRAALPALPNIHFAELLMRLDAAWRERRAMRQLDEEQLRDVGLTRADVERTRVADIVAR